MDELVGAEWSGLRGYLEPHVDHPSSGSRLAEGRAISSGLVEGARKQVGVITVSQEAMTDLQNRMRAEKP